MIRNTRPAGRRNVSQRQLNALAHCALTEGGLQERDMLLRAVGAAGRLPDRPVSEGAVHCQKRH